MIKNKEVFEKALENGTKLRSFIQDILRNKYKALSRAFGIISGKESRLLKFYTDLIYYKKGGYPSENTLPKHEQISLDFIEMIKFLDFMGIKDVMLNDIFYKYGLTVSIDSSKSIINQNINGDNLAKGNEILLKAFKSKSSQIKGRDLKTVIRELLSQTIPLQGQICEISDKIKYELTSIVGKACDVTKEDFKEAIQFNIDLNKNKMTNRKIETKTKNATSKVEVFKNSLTKLSTKKSTS